MDERMPTGKHYKMMAHASVGGGMFHALSVVMARSFKLGLRIGLLDLKSDCLPKDSRRE
jgi:hypothetical protein